MDSEYKEKSEYNLLHFIKQGSYGEVYGAQDLNTGFKYAVKKVNKHDTLWDFIYFFYLI